jgi:hypothetical protein
MRRFSKFALALVGIFSLVPTLGEALQLRKSGIPPLKEKLENKIEHFETGGKTLVECVLDIAYQYELPMGIEYLDRQALSRPLDLKFHDASIREVLATLVRQLPEYKIVFSDGLVDIFVPRERQVPSNLLNRVIKDFNVVERDTTEANAELACALSQEIDASRVCVSSIAKGQLGTKKITIHLRNAKVYELIDTIVAQNGKAAWVVIAPGSRLVGTDPGDLWHIYPLEAPFKEAVLEKLATLKQ